MHLAATYVVAGRWEDASEIYETYFLARESWFLYQWDAEWGFSHALMLAHARRALGEPYEPLLAELRAFLTGFDERGVSSPGIVYLRASLAAIEGNSNGAFDLLEAARDRGWRRWWWTSIDPSWSALRESDAFQSRFAELEAASITAGRLAHTSVTSQENSLSN
jgi:hypothetical protein